MPLESTSALGKLFGFMSASIVKSVIKFKRIVKVNRDVHLPIYNRIIAKEARKKLSPQLLRPLLLSNSFVVYPTKEEKRNVFIKAASSYDGCLFHVCAFCFRLYALSFLLGTICFGLYALSYMP